MDCYRYYRSCWPPIVTIIGKRFFWLIVSISIIKSLVNRWPSIHRFTFSWCTRSNLRRNNNYMYSYKHTYIYIFVYAYVYVCRYVGIYTYMCTYTYTCTYIIRIYIYMHNRGWIDGSILIIWNNTIGQADHQ
jgi:hypothetical protein